MDANPVVDPAAFDRLHGIGGEKLVRQIVRLYLENAGERVRQIDEGLTDSGDLGEAQAGAHSLKSSSANVGAMKVSDICASMEIAAARGEEATLRALREGLERALSEAADRLGELMEERYE